MDKKRFEAFVVSDRKGGEEKSPIRVDNTLSNGAGRTALPPRLARRSPLLSSTRRRGGNAGAGVERREGFEI